MKLIHIELYKYVRLYVTGIKHIDYRPNKKIQTILASNGSGKSSLLKEIIPNVEDLNTEYDTHGYRIATYEHRGDSYILSYHRDGNKHSFKHNGKELNTVGLKKTQKILIEEHFNITKPMHEMLLSTTTFTNMSVSERKHWFTKILTTIEYEYALSKYNKIKTKVKDLTSYIKLTQSKLLKDEEVLNNTTEEDIDILKKDKQMFRNIIENALSLKHNIPVDDAPNLNILESHHIQLDNLLNKIDKKDIDDIDSKIISKETTINILNKELTEVDSKLAKIDNLHIDNGVDTDVITNKIIEINDYIKNIDNLKIDSLEQLLDLVKYFNSEYGTISNIINEITSYVNIKDYNITDEELLEYKTLKENYVLNKERIDKVSKDLNIQESNSKNEDVTCPSCHTSFKPNFNKEELVKLEKEYDSLNTVVNELENKLNSLNTLLNNKKNIQSLINKLKSILGNYLLKPIYDYIVVNTDDFKKIDNLNNVFNKVLIQMPKYDDIKKLIDTRKELLDKKQVHEQMSEAKRNFILTRKEELVDNRKDIINKLLILRNELSILKNKKDTLNNLNSIINTIDDSFKQISKYKKSFYYKEFNRYIDNITYETNKIINAIDDEINEYSRIVKHHKELKDELVIYEKELKANKKLEEYLSPTKGIIGESITNTINMVLERMNFIINKIWSYEINILPCDINDSDLTFRFPVSINDAKIIPDINKGSSSIKEIIDVAFKITAMEFLDMLDYPLILDEFGKAFDEKHRIKSYDYIINLSNKSFSQIFMISHFESMYGRFNNTDIVILNKDNLEYNGTYNEVIKIK